MAARRAELLANGDLLVGENGKTRRVTKETAEHRSLLRAAARNQLEIVCEPGRFGGPESPPRPTLARVLGRLVARGSHSARRQAVSRAAYGGALRPAELEVLRRAGLIPYDYEAADQAGE